MYPVTENEENVLIVFSGTKSNAFHAIFSIYTYTQAANSVYWKEMFFKLTRKIV